MNRKIVAALAVVYVVWGSTYLAIKLALSGFQPFQLGAVRYSVAGLILFAFSAARGDAMPTRTQWRDAAIIGVLLLTIGNGGIVFAEQYTSSGMISLCAGAAPVIAVLWAGLFGRWPTPLQWLGVGVGAVGIVIMGGASELSGNPTAAMVATVAVSCWALGSVLSQRGLKPAPGLLGVACEMLAGGVGAAIVSVALGERMPEHMPLSSLQAMAYLVVAGSIVAFSAYMYLLPRVSAALATSNGYVNPVVAVCAGVAVNGERISPAEFVAGAFIVVGVAVIGLSSSAGRRRFDLIGRSRTRGPR